MQNILELLPIFFGSFVVGVSIATDLCEGNKQEGEGNGAKLNTFRFKGDSIPIGFKGDSIPIAGLQ